MVEHRQPQSKNGGTIIEQIVQQQENMGLSSCGSEEKVMLQCDEKACPSYGKQPLYCPECATQERHPHAPIFIAKKSKNVTNDWNNLRQDVRQLNQKVINWMSAHRPLVEVLDPILTNAEKKLRFQIEKLQLLNNNIESFYEQEVAESCAKGEIMKLQELIPSLNGFKERLQALDYLKNIGTLVLWKTYSEILHLVSQSHVLEKLSQENYDIFIKLKLYKVQLTQ
ncbi:hypothetical protein FGO68_gene8541 [Halteria grandinella]|uniref:Uncharacterized protein n=1 Tax=Halteria grandinella TaxID=5974 RepID=A0A8J8T317_HALGN|nr:hypothetical protein FGO68_gene8541 [Halteria grandinella]